MSLSPYILMQAAVDIVNSSPHPTSKIAATLAGLDADGKDFHVSRTNFWPEPILQRLGAETRIGNASGTVHAETACIFTAPRTDGASLFVTDPFCPNCAKNLAEAGIRRIYIDHKGFTKDFAARRGDHFENMSLQICEKAGISVYEIRRKEERIVPILEIPAGYVPPEDNPVTIENLSGSALTPLLDPPPFQGGGDTAPPLSSLRLSSPSPLPRGGVACNGRPEGGEVSSPFAAALAADPRGALFRLTALPHAAIGYTMEHDAGDIAHPQGKYTFIIEPVNRLLMAAARHGLKIREIYSSRVPTAREQVNLVGAGLAAISIGDPNTARDDDALAARDLLQKAGVVAFGTATA